MGMQLTANFVVVCTDLWGKESHRQASVNRARTSGSICGIMISTLARNPIYVGSIPDLGTISSIFIIAPTQRCISYCQRQHEIGIQVIDEFDTSLALVIRYRTSPVMCHWYKVEVEPENVIYARIHNIYIEREGGLHILLRLMQSVGRL